MFIIIECLIILWEFPGMWKMMKYISIKHKWEFWTCCYDVCVPPTFPPIWNGDWKTWRHSLISNRKGSFRRKAIPNKDHISQLRHGNIFWARLAQPTVIPIPKCYCWLCVVYNEINKHNIDFTVNKLVCNTILTFSSAFSEFSCE